MANNRTTATPAKAQRQNQPATARGQQANSRQAQPAQARGASATRASAQAKGRAPVPSNA